MARQYSQYAIILFFLIGNRVHAEEIKIEANRMVHIRFFALQKTKISESDSSDENDVININMLSKKQINSSNDSSIQASNPIKRKCSLKKTIFLCFIPGLYIHGIGHFYVKHYKTSALLLAIEGLSISYAYFGNNETGFALFYSSWGYDLIASSLICHWTNKKNAIVHLVPYLRKNQFGDGYAGLQLNIHF